MAVPFAASFRALVRPAEAFSPPPPPLGRAVGAMALVWMPLALANAFFSILSGLRAYGALRNGSLAPGLLGWLGVDPRDLQEVIAGLPAPPPLGRILPWLLLLVPLGVLGTWLHHAVWDHTALWLLGGLKAKRGIRTSLLAEAEALRIVAVGTLLGLLGFLPGLGPLLALPLLLLDAYLWLFRGFALAARHGCKAWQGVAATVLHAVLLSCCLLGLSSWLLFLVRMTP